MTAPQESVEKGEHFDPQLEAFAAALSTQRHIYDSLTDPMTGRFTDDLKRGGA